MLNDELLTIPRSLFRHSSFIVQHSSFQNAIWSLQYIK